jgi:PAS domain S-box-containing protein
MMRTPIQQGLPQNPDASLSGEWSQSVLGQSGLIRWQVGMSEDQLRANINSVPVLAWTARPDGSAVFFNERWLEYAGISIEEARDWGWADSIHPDDLNRLLDYWREILASGEPGEIEGRLRRYDGEYRWFLFKAEPLRDELGAIIRCAAFVAHTVALETSIE